MAVGSDIGDGLDFLRSGGKTALLVRSIDWSNTALGPPRGWPPVLKTTLAILFNCRQPMFLFWGTQNIQFYNDAYLPSFGVGGKHPKAMSQRGEECWPEIWDDIGPQIRDVVDKKMSHWHENQLLPILRNGVLEDVYWTYSYSPVFCDNGDVGGTLVVCTETTNEVISRKAAETSRRDAEESRARLHQLYMQAPVAICTLTGRQFSFDVVNPAFKDMLDRPVEVGSALCEIVAELAPDAHLLKIFEDVYDTGRPFDANEYPVRLKRNGKLEDVYLQFAARPLRNASGSVEGIIFIGSDVTRQVAAAQRAGLGERQYRFLAESIPQQVWTASAEGALDFVNQRAVAYFGASESQILGTGWQSMVHPDDLETCAHRWLHSLATGADYEVEFRLRRADGSYHWHLGRAVALRDSGGALQKWYGTNTNIDEQKKTREELQRRATFEKQLVGIVSHDLRNPLSAMLLGASTLLKRQETDERSARVLTRIVDIGERAGRMIRDLLDFTQARLGGGIPIAGRPTNLHELVQRAVEEVQSSHPHRRVDFEKEGDGNGVWDPDRVVQMLGNLLSNAFTHSAPATPIRVRTKCDDAFVEIQVQNIGPPIPEELVPVLFQPLSRAVGQPEMNRRSIGLGLFIVEQIVTAHGGSVSVESNERSGTKFTVRLPRTSPCKAT